MHVLVTTVPCVLPYLSCPYGMSAKYETIAGNNTKHYPFVVLVGNPLVEYVKRSVEYGVKTYEVFTFYAPIQCTEMLPE